MTEEFLNRPQVRPGTEHVRRERVAQVVRRELRVDRSLAQTVVEDAPHAAIGQTAATQAEEQRVVVTATFAELLAPAMGEVLARASADD